MKNAPFRLMAFVLTVLFSVCSTSLATDRMPPAGGAPGGSEGFGGPGAVRMAWTSRAGCHPASIPESATLEAGETYTGVVLAAAR